MRQLIHYFKIFYSWIGFKIFLFCFLVFSSTFIEGLAFTIALPILQYGTENISKYSTIIYNIIELLNFEVSILSLVILTAIIFTIKAIIRLSQEIIILRIVYKFQKELRIRLVKQYKEMSYSYYVNTEIGFFNNLITTEVAGTIAAFNTYTNMIVAVLTTAVYLIFALAFNWEIVILTVLLIISFYFLFLHVNDTIKSLSGIVVQANADLQNSFIQFILNFKFLKPLH